METQNTNTNVRRGVNTVYSYHTRSVMKLVNGGTGYEVALPIIDVSRKYLQWENDGFGGVRYTPHGSKVIVRGFSQIRTPGGTVNADYDGRWCLLDATELNTMIDMAESTNTINECRLLSRQAGVQVQGATSPIKLLGSEPGVILQLIGTPEAEAMATKYSFDYQFQYQLPTQQGLVDITYSNAILVTKQALMAAKGFGMYPHTEGTLDPVNRGDTENPDWLDAISFARATGQLPMRVRKTRNENGMTLS